MKSTHDKECNKCHRTKFLSEFRKQKINNTIYCRNSCKSCDNSLNYKHKKEQRLMRIEQQKQAFDKEASERLKTEMYRLDWIMILRKAIESRRTSWGEDVVREWRNASDEVGYAVIHAMEEAGLVQLSLDMDQIEKIRKKLAESEHVRDVT